jgi:hypothetical protein
VRFDDHEGAGGRAGCGDEFATGDRLVGFHKFLFQIEELQKRSGGAVAKDGYVRMQVQQ